MFRITTFDLNKVPKKENGEVDFSKDFFGKSTNLTVSGQLNAETYCAAFRNIYTLDLHSELNIQTQQDMLLNSG